jgi:hypothetical protein
LGAAIETQEVPETEAAGQRGHGNITQIGLALREFSQKNTLLVSGYTVFWAWFCVCVTSVYEDPVGGEACRQKAVPS